MTKDNKSDNNSTSKPSATDSEDNWVSTIEIPSGWFNMSIEHELRLCIVSYQEAPGYPSFVVSRSLVVKPDWTWTVYINGHLVDPSVPPNASIPPCLTGETAVVLQKINTLKICPGNPETRYVALAKNKKNKQFVSHSKK